MGKRKASSPNTERKIRSRTSTSTMAAVAVPRVELPPGPVISSSNDLTTNDQTTSLPNSQLHGQSNTPGQLPLANPSSSISSPPPANDPTTSPRNSQLHGQSNTPGQLPPPVQVPSPPNEPATNDQTTSPRNSQPQDKSKTPEQQPQNLFPSWPFSPSPQPPTNEPTSSLPSSQSQGQSNIPGQLLANQLSPYWPFPPSQPPPTNPPTTSLQNTQLPGQSQGQSNIPGQPPLTNPLPQIPPIPRNPPPATEPRLPQPQYGYPQPAAVPPMVHATALIRANQAEILDLENRIVILREHIQTLENMIRQANQREIGLRNLLFIQQQELEKERAWRNVNNRNGRL